jgi:hypothetical protein
VDTISARTDGPEKERTQMPSIGTLDGLFELAAADWSFTPPPPLRGGGHAPRVASRTISVVATVQSVAPSIFGQDGGESKVITLNYSPSHIFQIKDGIARIPASFSGNQGGADPLGVIVSITQNVLAGAYGVTIQTASLLTFSVPSPGGQPQGPEAALVGIMFSGQAEFDGQPAPFNISISQYTFLLQLK